MNASDGSYFGSFITFGNWLIQFVDVSNKVLNTFALVVNFPNYESVLCHFTISLFEAPNISGKTLMEIMKLLLVEIQLRSKVNCLCER
jgi:hypothetical protein